MFTKRSVLPHAIRSFVANEREIHALALEENMWLVASSTFLSVISEERIHMHEAWCAFARVAWNEPDRIMEIDCIDPGIRRLRLRPRDVPEMSFMDFLRDRIDAHQVFSTGRVLGNGTAAKVWVLRDSHGELFVTSTVDGPVTPAGNAEINEMEKKVRLNVGLE